MSNESIFAENVVLQVGKVVGEKDITITNDTGRLSSDDIEKMVQEAEKFKEDDTLQQQKTESKNQLESFLYGLHSSFEKSKDKLSEDDVLLFTETLSNTTEWLSEERSGEDYESKLQEIQKKLESIMGKLNSTIPSTQSDPSTMDASTFDPDMMKQGDSMMGGKPTIDEID